MKVSFSKKRTIIASIVLILMVQILWIYPLFIQNPGNQRWTMIVLLISVIFLYIKFDLNNILKGILSFLTLIIVSYYLFTNLQAPLGGIELIYEGGLFLNTGLVLLFMLLLFLITNSVRLTGIITSSFLILFAFINMFVVYFRGKAIAPTDIHSVQTALGVSSNYTLWMNDFVVKDILLLFLFCIIFSQMDYKIEKTKIRAIIVVTGFLGILIAILMFYSPERIEEKGFTLEKFVPFNGTQKNGYLLDFYLNCYGLSVSKPAGYDVKNIQTISDEYKVKREKVSDEQTPNILILMNESFFDPRCLGEIEYSSEPLDFFYSLEENTIRGNLLSSVFGGNTPNSEFECLTGSSMAFFPKDSIVYQNFLHDELPTTVSLLSDLGYYGIGMHPYNKIYWERDRVYPEVLMFDEFISQDEIVNPDIVREYISDQQVFDILMDRMKTDGEDSRLFNFTITMQNHGGYYFGMTDVTAPEINNPYVNEYLSIINITDESFEKFIKELEEFDEPTIVCMFGDHQPRFEDSVYDTIWKDSVMTEEEKEIAKHVVPFVIWANYDIEEADIPLTSINYMSPMILEAAGVSLSPYYRYLLDLQENYPVISSVGCFDSDMHFYPIGKEMDAIIEMNEYEMIQYNYIHDTKNRVDEFYVVGE